MPVLFAVVTILLYLSAAPTSHASGTKALTKSLEDKIPSDITQTDKDKIITLVLENDLFSGRGQDNNYTSGVRLTYFDINTDLPRLAYTLDDYIPTFEINDTTSVHYSVGHNIYTPQDIRQRRQDPDDRPWAAHLYTSMALVTYTDNHLDEIEASLGVVGSLALGEEAQKFVHKYISKDSPTPLGWDNQLGNEPTLGLGWTRRFPRYYDFQAANISFGMSPYFGLTAGNVYTFANTGVNLRLSPASEKWQDAPIRVRPTVPGTGFFEIPENKHWSWYTFAGLEGRALARNIFLDGNTFSNSHSVDKKHFVADANAGIAITYDQYRVSYTLVYRTKEFEGQDDPTVFGAFSFGYRF